LSQENGETVYVQFPLFDLKGNEVFTRPISAMPITLADGTIQYVATVYDVMLAQYGISQQKDVVIEDDIYTPTWQEKVTGVKASLVTQIAREFAQNSIDTG